MWKSTNRNLNTTDSRDTHYRCGFYVRDLTNTPSTCIQKFTELNIYHNENSTFTASIYGDPIHLQAFLTALNQNPDLQGARIQQGLRIEDNYLTYTATPELMKRFVVTASMFDQSMILKNDRSVDMSLIHAIARGISDGARSGIQSIALKVPKHIHPSRYYRVHTTAPNTNENVPITPMLNNLQTSNNLGQGPNHTTGTTTPTTSAVKRLRFDNSSSSTQ